MQDLQLCKTKFLCRINSLARKSKKSLLETVAKCRKVSLTGSYSPKYGLNQKTFVCIFIPETFLKKKLWQTFFHQNNILEVFSTFVTLELRNINFGLILPKIGFFAKTMDFSEKCLMVTPRKIEKKCGLRSKIFHENPKFSR